MQLVACNKCNGVGRLDEYRGINDGICYLCKGTGQMRPVADALRRKVKQPSQKKLMQDEADAIKTWYHLKDYRMEFGKHEGKRIRDLILIGGEYENSESTARANVEYFSWLTGQKMRNASRHFIAEAFSVYANSDKRRFEYYKQAAKNPKFDENKDLYHKISGGLEA